MRISPRTTVVLHDLCMTAIAWELAWLARFNFSVPAGAFWLANLETLPMVLITQGAIAWWFGLYRGLWRFASLPDLWNIIRAAVLGALCVTVVLFVTIRLDNVPRSLLVLYPMFLIFLLGGPRLAYRVWKDHSLSLKNISGGKRVLVIGAGRAGDTLIRDMARDGTYVPVGLIDDQAKLVGTHIRGVPVLGTTDDLPRIVSQQAVDFIIIAIPSATNVEMQHIVRQCEQTGIAFRTLPRLDELVTGEPVVTEVRKVAIDDLLGRDKVELDWQAIQDRLSGKCVMVSGGGGSIGSELCSQVARLMPSTLIVFERSEDALYRVERSLRRQFPSLALQAVLGDVCDEAAVDHALKRYGPQVIFHAAAYKHVPILQSQAREAVRNNVLGTQVLAETADRHGCETFVLISTDKAVNPINFLGASKRLAEIFCGQMNQRSATRFITVRFGNVLGSAGSVVPLFQEQIQRGGPVTVTHPEVRRYFMTIPEACQLILQAGAMGQGGEIFVLDMGEPIKITFLAEQMVRLSGLVPGRDVRIEFTGLRPGEKLDEELFHGDENLESTQHKKILLAHHRLAASSASITEAMRRLERACKDYDEDAIEHLLRELVPSYARAEHSSSNVVALKGVGQ